MEEPTEPVLPNFIEPNEEVLSLSGGPQLTEDDVVELKNVLDKIVTNNFFRNHNIKEVRHDIDMWAEELRHLNILRTYQQVRDSIRKLENAYKDIKDTLQVRASTVEFASPVPTTVQQQLEEMKATIKQLQARLDASQTPQHTRSATPTAPERQLRFH